MDTNLIGIIISVVLSVVTALATSFLTLGKYKEKVDRLERDYNKISDKGEKLVEDSGFNKIFESIKDDLVKELAGLEPHSQYDTQEKARMMLSGMTTDKRFRQIEDWAYKNGEDLAQILRAGSIKLRDYYFEKHPEIVDPREKY